MQRGSLSMMIREHHQRAIDRLTNQFRDDSRYLALIIGGSVAKGIANDSSDVDAMFLVTDEEYEKRKKTRQLGYYDTAICDYPGGYIDGKIIDLAFLLEAADHGSEPTRSSFSKAFIAFSHIPDLEQLIARIPVYQEQERDEKILSFYSQIMLFCNYFMIEAEHRNDPYLIVQSTASLVLFTGRLFLAYNRILFPCEKRLMETLEHTPELPSDLLERIHALLAQPGIATAHALRDSILGFRDWGITFEQAVVRYTQDTEQRWRIDRPDLAEW
jgi:predicted nucleotidyltransferase